ncbi:hypothetical protein AMK59_1208, partial [Oryctes borbonicus]
SRAGCGDHSAQRDPKKLYCYECNSLFDPRCGLEFDNYTIALVDCSQKPRPQHLPTHYVPSVCRKSIQRVQGRIRVVRGCGYIEDHAHDDGTCFIKTGTHDVHITHCSCTHNACNRGHSNLDQQTPASLYLLVSFTIISTLSALFRIK